MYYVRNRVLVSVALYHVNYLCFLTEVYMSVIIRLHIRHTHLSCVTINVSDCISVGDFSAQKLFT